MSYSTAEKAIDFLAAHSIDCDEVSVSFYGGEPLLAFDLITKTVAYAKERLIGKKIIFSMTINGTLLTPPIMQYLYEQDIELVISLDGPKIIHDKYRCFRGTGDGSFDIVMRNINILYQKYPDYASKLQISMVVNPENDYNSIVQFAAGLQKSMGISNILDSLVDNIFKGEEVVVSDDYLIKSRYQDFLAILALYKIIDKSNASVLSYNNMVDHFNNDKDKLIGRLSLPAIYAPGGPCIAGEVRAMVNIDENIFPCEKVSETSELMEIGTLDHGFYQDKAAKLINIASTTAERCKNCWAIDFCNICAKKADGIKEVSVENKLKYCRGSINNALYMLEIIILQRELQEYYHVNGGSDYE